MCSLPTTSINSGSAAAEASSGASLIRLRSTMSKGLAHVNTECEAAFQPQPWTQPFKALSRQPLKLNRTEPGFIYVGQCFTDTPDIASFKEDLRRCRRRPARILPSGAITPIGRSDAGI